MFYFSSPISLLQGMVLVAQVLQSKVMAVVHREYCQTPGKGVHTPTKPLPSKNLCPCCFSHRNDFCEPSLIGSLRLNQVNEDLLFKDWVPSQLTWAEAGWGGSANSSRGIRACVLGMKQRKVGVWWGICALCCGSDFCLACF